MRQICFDTETTGFDPSTGDRLVSLAAVELVNQEPTGRFVHFYLNPGRPSSEGALNAHGLTEQFLADKPTFADVAARVAKILGTGQIVAHNAQFDLKFLNAELNALGLPGYLHPAICTLDMAQRRYGRARGRNTLDALATRFCIPNLREKTGKHGALIDCLMLVQVFRALLGKPILVDWDLTPYLGNSDESQRPTGSQGLPEIPQVDAAPIACIPGESQQGAG